MNTTMDVPEVWSITWQRSDPGPVNLDLKRIVRRDRTRLTLTVALEAVVVVSILGYGLAVLQRSPTLERGLLFGALVFFAVLAIAFNVWNRSGLWRDCAETTAAYVALSIDRCCAHLLAARFAVALMLAETVFILGWHFVTGWMNGDALSDKLRDLFLILLVANLAVLVSMKLYTQKTRRELQRLRSIRTQLGGAGA
jgi:hypothetical protein